MKDKSRSPKKKNSGGGAGGSTRPCSESPTAGLKGKNKAAQSRNQACPAQEVDASLSPTRRGGSTSGSPLRKASVYDGCFWLRDDEDDREEEEEPLKAVEALANGTMTTTSTAGGEDAAAHLYLGNVNTNTATFFAKGPNKMKTNHKKQHHHPLRYHRTPPCFADHGLYFTLGPILSPESCDFLCSRALSSRYHDWVAFPDSVDGKPEHQHCILDVGKSLQDPVLLPFVQQLSDEVILPQLLKWKNEPGKAGASSGSFSPKRAGAARAAAPCSETTSSTANTEFLPASNDAAPSSTKTKTRSPFEMHWAFLRRYSVDTRLEFPVHRDKSSFTVNILLSDDYTGAELYLLPDNTEADALPIQTFRKRFPASKLKAEYAVRAHGKGYAVCHQGRRLHGVLPIESGTRITLILMYIDNL
ncbi:unnamed protein product [Amoebophrya sp. A120]|nr:unnamed protein product [Amoebophrya sp. A120]|eukprot:GSA120T00000626001.1